MLGTGIGIFWIDFILKPGTKELLKHPSVLVLAVCILYGYVGYIVLKSTYLSDNR